MQRYKFLGLNQDHIEVCSISLRRDNLKEYFKFVKACKAAGLKVVESKTKNNPKIILMTADNIIID